MFGIAKRSANALPGHLEIVRQCAAAPLLITLALIFEVLPSNERQYPLCAAEPPGNEKQVVQEKTAEIPIIDYHKARDYVGQEVGVELTVTQTRNIGKICFLNVDNAREFVVPLFSEMFKDVPEGGKPEKFYLNKKLRVTGKITLYKDKPQIEVHQVNQIQVLGAADPEQQPTAKAQKPVQQKPAVPANFQLPHIKPEMARDHLGKAVVIEGIVDLAHKRDGECRLAFGVYPPEDELTLVIPPEIAQQYPRGPGELFLYQHVLVSGEVEAVGKKLVLNITQSDQIRLDQMSAKLAQTKVVSVDEALARDGEYLGVRGTVENVAESEHFYTVKLLGSDGKVLRIAVDKICLPQKDAISILKDKAHTFYGKIMAAEKAAQMIIGDRREIVPLAEKK